MSAVIHQISDEPRHSWQSRRSDRIATFRLRKGDHTRMTNDGIFSLTVLNSWKLNISRFDKTLGDLTDDELQQQVAPGKNRVFYLLGHLTVTHDRMFPLLGLGERLFPELDDAYITNPDRALGDPLSATELRKAWAEVNKKLTGAFEEFTMQDWLQKHAAVSDEDFAEDPSRNRLAVVISRTNHASYHSGQAILGGRSLP
jgi:hypothetical protein